MFVSTFHSNNISLTKFRFYNCDKKYLLCERRWWKGAKMLKCLVSENDTVVETFLSESVLEEEYLQEEVRANSLEKKIRKKILTIFSFLIISSEKMSCFHCIIWGKRGIGGNCSWKLWSLYKWFLILRNCVDASCTQQPISTFQTPPAPFQWVPSTKYQPTPLWSTLPPLISDTLVTGLTHPGADWHRPLARGGASTSFQGSSRSLLHKNSKFSHLDESCAQIKEFETPPCMEAQQW